MIVDGWDFSPENLMAPAKVAATFGVDPKTVTRWATTGKLAFVRTPGGVRRYSRQQVEHLLTGGAR